MDGKIGMKTHNRASPAKKNYPEEAGIENYLNGNHPLWCAETEIMRDEKVSVFLTYGYSK
jgi:hypothetical protein